MESTDGKVITCKAAIVYESKSPIKVETIRVLPPGPGHVRVKMVATGLCHSDLVMIHSSSPALKYPFVPGHEGGGIVESVGAGVTSVKKGDRVFTMLIPHCGECPFCLKKRTNICLDTKRKFPMLSPFVRNECRDGSVSFSTPDGQAIYHGNSSSSFAEYTVIPENSCVKVNPKVNFKAGCLLACSFMTGFGMATNSVDMKPGDTVAIWGLGGVGLACVVGCKDRGAAKIIGVDVYDEKEALAKKFGCTDYIALSNIEKGVTTAQKIKQLTQIGVDFAFVCVGSASALESAITSLTIGGTAVMAGAAPPTDNLIISPALFLAGINVKGTVFGDYSIFDDIPKLVDRYVNGELPVDDFVTNTFTLNQINEAVDLMHQGKGIRSVIQFE